METNFSLCLFMHVCKVLKYQLLSSVRQEKGSIPCAQFTQSSALKSRAFTEWQLVCCLVICPSPTYEFILYEISVYNINPKLLGRYKFAVWTWVLYTKKSFIGTLVSVWINKRSNPNGRVIIVQIQQKYILIVVHYIRFCFMLYVKK